MYMLKITKINKEIVKTIKKVQTDSKNIRGSSMFPEIYSNIFLLARKKSGKTVLLFNILKKCIGRNTRVIIFSGTAYKDYNMVHIRKYLKKKKIEHEVHQSIMDGKVNILKNIIDELQIQSEIDAQSSDSENEQEQSYINIGEEYEEEEVKERKEKLLSPEIIFVFDDQGKNLRNQTLSTLITRNRHFLCKTIICSQYLHQLQPESIVNLDYILMFGQTPVEKLIRIHELLEVPVTYERFYNMYMQATAKKYNFLYVSSEGEFRINFNLKFD